MGLICVECSKKVKMFEYGGKKFIEEHECKTPNENNIKIVEKNMKKRKLFDELGMKTSEYVVFQVLRNKTPFEMMKNISNKQTRKCVDKYLRHLQKKVLDGTLFEFLKANHVLSFEEIMEALARIGRVKCRFEIEALVRAFKKLYTEKVES